MKKVIFAEWAEQAVTLYFLRIIIPPNENIFAQGAR